MSEPWKLPEDGGPSTSKRSKFEVTVNSDCQVVRTNTTLTSTESVVASELDERIFTYVSNSNSFSFANFGFLKLGPLCNASESHSFTEANCHLKTVKNKNNLAFVMEFSQLFNRGVMLLSDVKNSRRELDHVEIAAIRILNNFFKEKGFPGVVGCVDGTMVKIKAPHVNEADYICRKGYHALNIQMTCDPRFRVIDLVAKWPGSVHDSRIFRESQLCKIMEEDQHEKCLKKVMQGQQSDKDKKGFLGTEITVTIAEHLLGKLAPGKSYVVNENEKRKGKCRCGYDFCRSDAMFGSTGIGHEEGWHGFADVVFSSNDGVHDIAVATHVNESQDLAPDDDFDDDIESSSSGGKNISEAKPSLLQTNAENRAVAQTIVFSFLQKKRHPEFSNLLIPNILISPQEFRIIMYDAVNDILLCSVPLPIFQPCPSNSLEIASIIILWMVLHYGIFCEGTDALIREIGIDKEKIQADFKEVAKEKLELYVNSLKYGVQGFPFIQKESLPSYKALMLGVHLL